MLAGSMTTALRVLARPAAAAAVAARGVHSLRAFSLRPAVSRASLVAPGSARRASPFAGPTGALRSMFIQTETTPNPQSIKFLPGRAVLDERFTTGYVRGCVSCCWGVGVLSR
jgi:hypothetical protein